MSKKKNVVKKNSPQARTYSEKKQNSEMVYALKLMAITQQEMLDTAHMALAEEFGLGPERQKRFHDRFEKLYGELRQIEREDTDDKEYYIETCERKLRACLGKYYEERDVRYDMNIIDRYGNTWKI